jgi:hypothetical protein
MSKQTSITTLRKYSFIAWSASLLIIAFGVISFLLFIKPSLIDVNRDSSSSYEGNFIWLVFGALFVILGIVFQSIAYRWSRHLLLVLNSRLIKPMRVKIEVDKSSDHTQYYACLFDDSAGVSPKGWRVGLWGPSRHMQELISHELSAIVYLDPQTAKPAVIEYANGYLWGMKGNVTPYTESPISSS